MTPQAQRIFFEAEAQAEWFIGILRLIISSSLAVVLFVTVWFTGLPDSRVLELQLIYAAMTMLSYFGLGLGIIVLIGAGRFRAWMAWPSALIDCVFVLLGTWLSLSNMGLSGQFIAAFPTIWLVPVVLACGALRFNPPLLACMSVVLIVGFVAILTIPFLATEAEARAGLIFLFGWPPNLVRIVMIALAAGVLVTASMRIRALLRRSIDEAEARGQLTRFLPAELDGQLATRGLDAMREGQQQRMAVVFVDIRGFTARAETLSPADLSAFLARYRASISKAADETGGIVDKFVGDGAMVVFDDRHSDAATCAVAFAREVLGGVQDVRLGIGIHLGEVFAGVVGGQGRLEYTVLGDTVNVAARLEAATKVEGVSLLVSEDVMQALDVRQSDWQHFPSLALPGRQQPISAWGLNKAPDRMA
ncbi:adenylate/guanylate cyclase domain-containing protein [Tateyamaria omphalii]|uniref:adenylate/guanylate cyclase domain-containing protein n=1 Tax=Tateyamaria omphalii TaxID=299262 RepID=UPI001C9938FC|nr:adenylate/guanylate cyclase domain-containing protein [Tateyamaria omphalii]MBY5933168.1 adenylate/guanylate cyclase domain-containing protein [Tateyamaria omphalii]